MKTKMILKIRPHHLPTLFQKSNFCERFLLSKIYGTEFIRYTERLKQTLPKMVKLVPTNTEDSICRKCPYYRLCEKGKYKEVERIRRKKLGIFKFFVKKAKNPDILDKEILRKYNLRFKEYPTDFLHRLRFKK